MAAASVPGPGATVTLTWTDNANNETGFTIQYAANSAFTANLNTRQVAANSTVWVSGNLPGNTDFYFRIRANNAAGSSAWVNAVPFPVHTPAPALVPAAPSSVGVVAAPAPAGPGANVTVTWADNSSNESRFAIQYATNAAFTTNVTTRYVGAGGTIWVSGRVPSSLNLYFRVRAENAAGSSAWVNATPFPVLTP